MVRHGLGSRISWRPAPELANAILYAARTGIAWRHLPHGFPPHATATPWRS
ncbi:transposase [Kitasatospora sp. NPDC101183]|uniref:transposase n=1 Tax=Kitasatospora sp. NPDC101183 TaxID=3364100 RepID=UPI0038257A7A